MKEEATVTTDAVPTTKLLFGMYDCTFDSDVGMGDFSLVWGGYTCVDTRTCDRTCLRE